jgi:hypothetical protein
MTHFGMMPKPTMFVTRSVSTIIPQLPHLQFDYTADATASQATQTRQTKYHKAVFLFTYKL